MPIAMTSAYSEDVNDQFYKGEAFQSFFKNSAQSIVIKANAPHFTILAVSDCFVVASLKTREDLLGKSLFDVFPDNFDDPTGKHSALKAFMEVIEKKEKVDLPAYKYDIFSYENRKMEPLYWSNSNQPVFNATGEVAYIVNTTTRITSEVLLKQIAVSSAENMARQQQELNSMFLKAPVGMAVYSKDDFVIEYANEAICRMWNKGNPGEVVGKSIFTLIPSLEQNGYRKIYTKVVETGIAYVSKESPVTYDRNGLMETYYFDLHFEPVYAGGKEVTGILSLANEVTEQVLTRRIIENAEERLRLASDATGIGSWDLDLQTREIIYSPRLADLFGYPGQMELSHEVLRASIHPEDRENVEQAFRTALTSGKYSYQSRIIRPDHVIYWISVTGKVLFSEGHIPVRMLGTVMDITETKQEEIQKNDFIAIASHELKTPLTSLKGYAQLLKAAKSTTDPVFVNSIATRIESQINKMTRLVYSFLDLSRIESKKTELNMERIDLNAVIREVANDYLLQEQNHPLTFEPQSLPLIYADRQKIAQVLDNLISNAIKYSPKGGAVVIKASLENEEVLVSVEDHGIGIDNNHRIRIFDRFYRVDDQQVKNASGFGIGLYLCADIIKRHKGQIDLRSEPGKGSSFYFTIPVNPR